jgi:hypothetical protein
MRKFMTKISYEAMVVFALVVCVATVAASWLHAFGHLAVQ